MKKKKENKNDENNCNENSKPLFLRNSIIINDECIQDDDNSFINSECEDSTSKNINKLIKIMKIIIIK